MEMIVTLFWKFEVICDESSQLYTNMKGSFFNNSFLRRMVVLDGNDMNYVLET